MPQDFTDLAESLDRDGFVVWRELLPHAAIDHHLGAYEALAAELGIDSPIPRCRPICSAGRR